MYNNEEDEMRLIQEISYAGRTILTWYNTTQKFFGFTIFNYRDQPNICSKLHSLTQWGYVTYNGVGIAEYKEASEVVTHYITDLFDRDFWWENDENFVITEEIWKELEEKTGEKRPEKEDTGRKTHLKLVE